MQPKPAHLGPEYGAQFADPSVVAAYQHRPAYPADVFSVLAGLVVGEPRVVLDAGCGTGDIARGLVARVDRVDALDISAAMVATGRTLAGGEDARLRWIVGPAEDADLTPPYGLIVAGESLHWMEWNLVLPRFRQALAPGGVLAIAGRTPMPAPWDADLQALINRYSTNRLFQPYNLIDEIESRGLFTRTGQHQTTPVTVTQLIPAFVESFHSRNGFSRDRMPAEDASAFDAGLAAILAPYAEADSVTFQIAGTIVWGAPGQT